MSADFDFTCHPHWGYFPPCCFKEGSPYREEGECGTASIIKVWNIASYIPIVNIAIGCLRLYSAFSDFVRGTGTQGKTELGLRAVRGVCDIVLGPLNIIIDLIVTVVRVVIANSEEVESQHT